MQLRSCHILRKCLTFVDEPWLLRQHTRTRARAHAHTTKRHRHDGRGHVGKLYVPSRSHQCRVYTLVLLVVPTDTESGCALCSCPRSNVAATNWWHRRRHFVLAHTAEPIEGERARKPNSENRLVQRQPHSKSLAHKKSIAPEKPTKKYIASLAPRTDDSNRIYAILCGHLHAKPKVSTHIETHALQSTTTTQRATNHPTHTHTNKRSKKKLTTLLLPLPIAKLQLHANPVLISQR